MRTLLRNLMLASLPLVIGVATGVVFVYMQQSCGHLVGPLFSAKCHGRMMEYQLRVQTAGTALGCVIAAVLGTVLELRARRAVQRASTEGVQP